MGFFRQQRESAAVLACTVDFRMYANMHLLPDKSTADLLNVEKREFIPLTDVRLFAPGHDDPPDPKAALGQTPFFGLNRQATLWVAGGRAPVTLESASKEVKVAMIFHRTMLAGVVRIPSAARLSDYLDTTKQFRTMFNVRLYPLTEGQALSEIKSTIRFDFVTVNSRLSTGLIEG